MRTSADASAPAVRVARHPLRITKSPEWKVPDMAAPVHGADGVRDTSTEVEQLPKKPAAPFFASVVVPVVVVTVTLRLIMTL